MIEEEKVHRGKQIYEMTLSAGYKKHFKPYIEKQIISCKNIKKIDVGNIEKSFIERRAKLDMYEGFLNTIKTWLKEGGIKDG